MLILKYEKTLYHILVSFLSVLVSFSLTYVISLIRYGGGGGPYYFGPALAAVIEALIVFVVFFLMIRMFSGRYFLDESWGACFGFALLELIAWPVLLESLLFISAAF